MTDAQINDVRGMFEHKTRTDETDAVLQLVAELHRERYARDHLRNRVRELLRRLPVDLPPMAANMRMVVAALVSQATERMEREGRDG